MCVNVFTARAQLPVIGGLEVSTRRRFLKILVGSIAASLAALVTLPASYRYRPRRRVAPTVGPGVVELPLPRLEGGVAVERALADRRSIREYLDEPLTLEELAQVLWAAYGITETRYGFKTSPSAGATYPLEIYAVAAPGGVRLGEDFLEPGSYHYDPHSHTLSLVRRGDLRDALYRAALDQEWVRAAPVNLVFTAVFERTTSRYGPRGERYVWIEVGHAGQNVYLQATAMGLATVAIGAFHDDQVLEVVGAGPGERAAYIMPLARPRWRYRLDPESLERYIGRHRG